MTTDPKLTDRAVAGVVAAMVARFDVADTLVRLLEACATTYPADAAAILVSDQRGGLELLSGTSHRAEEIELLQQCSTSGPCVDAIRTDAVVISSGAEMVERWEETGTAILAAGYNGVHAFPMHWRGRPIGGLNIFVGKATNADLEVGQMFADLATLAVLQPQDLSVDQLVSRVHDAASNRTVIEQAKGVLAHRHGGDMDEAFLTLMAEARDSGRSLTSAAQLIIERAYGTDNTEM